MGFSQPRSNALEKAVNKKPQTQTLKDAIKELENQYRVTFTFAADVITNQQVNSDKWKYQTSIDSAVKYLLTGFNLWYRKIDAQNLVIKPAISVPGTDTLPAVSPLTVSRSDKTLTVLVGKVDAAESGHQLPGASVELRGTSFGTISDDDGRFSLAVPEEELPGRLVVTMIGYQPYEKLISSQKELQIFLLSDSAIMGEVVVIGYGTQKKTNIIGSHASVSESNFRDLPVNGFDQALKGQAAGVQVIQNSGAPSAGLSIRIRGISSISAGNDPLYVIDGFPVSGGTRGTEGVPNGGNPLNNINPADIESIDILKDASATAIYGSRGANGVVIITTKSGKAGKGKFTFTTYNGVQKITKKLSVLNAAEFADLFIEARNNGFLQSGGNPSTPNALRGAYAVPTIYFDPSQWQETNWQNQIYRTGRVQNFNLAANGGNENVRYSISGGYLSNQAIIIQSALRRYSFRANVDAAINKRIKVGFRLSPSYTLNNEVNSDGFYNAAIVGMSLRLAPIIGPYNADGSYTNPLAMRTAASLGSLGVVDNPVAKAKEDKYDLDQIRVLANTYVDFKLFENLSFRTSIGIDGNFNRSHRFLSSKTGRAAVAPPSIPSGNASSSQEIEWLTENVFTFDQLFRNHRLNATAGFSAQKDDYRIVTLTGTNFPNDNVQTLSAAGTILTGSENRNQFSLVSYYGRANYSFKDRYLITATVRRDGSSRFGELRKYGTFPSAAIGWRMSGEKFMEALPFISNLKWRLSYGISGNNNIGNYNFVPNIVNSTYVLGTTPAVVSAISPGRLANKSITWETKHTVDMGVDISLFHRRVDITADVYKSNTDGLLLNVNIPGVSGFATSLENVGEVQNKGVELAVNAQAIRGKFIWNPSFNIAFNRNKVLALGGSAGDFIAAGNSRTVVGRPLGLFYMRVTDGIFQSAQEIAASLPQDNNPLPGDRKFRDINKDGKIDNKDLDFVGDPNPDFTFGFTNSFSYKGFDLNVLMSGSKGNDIYYNYVVGANLAGIVNQDAVVRTRWRSPENPGNGNVPRNVFGFTTLADTPSDFYIFDGSFLRVTNVTLGYTLPKSVAAKVRVQSARVYVGTQNLFTFTKYPGYDPEIGGNGNNPLQSGVDAGIFPMARVVTLGLSISF